MTLLLRSNNNDVVYFGPRSNPKDTTWWVSNGIIHWAKESTGETGTVTRKEFLLRLKAVNDMLANGKRADTTNFAHRDEIERQLRFVEQGCELAKKAKSQGDPTNDKQLRQMINDGDRPSIIVPTNYKG